MVNNRGLSFIHMSDIHFNKNSGDGYDMDNELRQAVINDLIHNAKNNIDVVNGVLVCGDIAYSGQEQEYDIAKAFLCEITNIYGLGLNDVFCVPGNHDVNQGVIKESQIIESMQEYIVDIDKKEQNKLDDCLRKVQNDPYIEGILYKAISTYNDSVLEMASDFSVENPIWQSEMKLNDEYVLSIYGMNSVLASNHRDHYINEITNSWEEREMVMNRTQIPKPREKVIYMSLCHHPPECWINKNLSEYMDERVKIQLYGHKHIQKIDANNKRLRISSGALQPVRDNDWFPRYNWIKIYIEDNELVIWVYPRKYNDIRAKFECDFDSLDNDDKSKEYKIIRIHLEECDNDVEENGSEIKNIRKTTTLTKEIVYRFCVLSNAKKKSVLRKYSCIKYESNKIDDLLEQLELNSIENEFLEELRRM